jgi:hypothetical protein
MAIVGREKAALKPLNSYLLMADLETDENWEVLPETTSIEQWARNEIKGRIGYDPKLTPIGIAHDVCLIIRGVPFINQIVE